MKKVTLILFIALPALLAACFTPKAQYTYLTDDLTSSIYPQLKPGTKVQNAYVERYDAVVPNYEGWLPAVVVKVSPQQAHQCRAYNYTLIKGCDGSLYCVYPAPNAPIYVYVGNYTKLLVDLGVTKGLGNESARLWIVQLLDPLCPYCALFYKQGGAEPIIEMVKLGKAYLIPIVVAFHKNAPGYEESLRIAYVQNEMARAGNATGFFELERRVAQNMEQIYKAQKTLVKLNLTLSELERLNQENLAVARRLFPYVATPGNVFVDRPTGRAIAVMGALKPQGVMTVINLLYKEGGPQ
ncbi:MAG: hypothetical protein GXO07_01725 [Crenarchaeota archaeon]|nr:hypothetical protein [Thermoproteota archaeon]